MARIWGNKLKHKKILIFGGTGYLGNALVPHYAGEYNDVMVFSRDEAKHWNMAQKFKSLNITNFIGDCRDKSRVREAFRTFYPNVVLIVSALKQIPFCETYPYESIQTNVVGVQNIVDCCSEFRVVDTCLFISSDKACSPVNAYGMCKALSEKIMAAAAPQNKQTRFLTVRYGNVADSTGSILPLFRMQCKNGQPLTITSNEMTRFVMTYKDSLKLIDKTIECGASGDIWIPILPSMRIRDLAEIFVERFGATIKEIGIRPGEKIHEELVNITEGHKVKMEKVDDGYYYVIKPSLDNFYSPDTFTYVSNQVVLEKNQLSSYLEENGLLYV